MPEIVIRPLLPEDLDGYHTVMSLTYGDGTFTPPADPEEDHSDSCGAILDGKVLGGFTRHPMVTARGKAKLRTHGIAGVAVAPDARRGGVGISMMQWAIRDARNQGVPLMSLYPFREPFYGKCGYVTAGKRLRLTVPGHRLPALSSELPVRRLTPDDWTQLEPAYQAFAQQRSGMHLRSAKMWKRVLNENRPLTIMAFGDPIEAYVAYWPSGAFWVEAWISEFIWGSRAGYEAGLTFLRQLAMNKTSISWYEPSDSPYYARFLDAQVDVKVERPIMFRVADVPAALQLLQPEASGSFTLAVKDAIVPENEGPWRVSFESGGVTVGPFSGEADLSMRIHEFTQAFLGEPSLSDLVRHQLVEVRSAEGLAGALKLLTPSPTICNDFF